MKLINVSIILFTLNFSIMASNNKTSHLKTEIIIPASKEQVWSLLTKTSDYPNWNPFIISFNGKLEVNEKLEVTMQQPDKKPMTFQPVVQKVIENEYFEWYGKMPLGMFNGRHYFKLEDIGNGNTKLIHGEYFTGWMHKLLLKKIGEDTRNGFIKMNQAMLKQLELKQ